MEEIQTPEFGAGLDGVLRDRRDDLLRNPERRRLRRMVPREGSLIQEWLRYFESPGEKSLQGQSATRIRPFPSGKEVPLIGVISRLTEQKGFDLIASIMEEMMTLDLQIVFWETERKSTTFFWRPCIRNIPAKWDQNCLR